MRGGDQYHILPHYPDHTILFLVWNLWNELNNFGTVEAMARNFVYLRGMVVYYMVKDGLNLMYLLDFHTWVTWGVFGSLLTKYWGIIVYGGSISGT